jgi:hypothetical protein
MRQLLATSEKRKMLLLLLLLPPPPPLLLVHCFRSIVSSQSNEFEVAPSRDSWRK